VWGKRGGKLWIGCIWLRVVLDSREHDKQSSVSIKGGNIFV
jgi:hypothetical protein